MLVPSSSDADCDGPALASGRGLADAVVPTLGPAEYTSSTMRPVPAGPSSAVVTKQFRCLAARRLANCGPDELNQQESPGRSELGANVGHGQFRL